MSTEHDSGVALVVGGGNGLGRESCNALAGAGFRVAVADLSAAAAASVADGLPGTAHRSYEVDVAIEEDVARLFHDAERDLGPIRVLANFAGLLIARDGQKTGLANTEVAEWDRTFAVNARGSFLVVREMLRRRHAAPVQHGRIILFSSLAAQVGGLRGSAAYSSAKGAVLSLMKAAAREGAPLGVTANAIAPGLIETQMLRKVYSAEEGQQATAAIPLARIGTPAEVAAVVLFLASAGSSYVTGSTLDVNGGLRMQ